MNLFRPDFIFFSNKTPEAKGLSVSVREKKYIKKRKKKMKKNKQQQEIKGKH